MSEEGGLGGRPGTPHDERSARPDRGDFSSITKATPADAGCWVEGSRGWTGTVMVIDIAHSNGFPLDAAGLRFLEAYRQGNGDETHCGVCGFRLRHSLTPQREEYWAHQRGLKEVDGKATYVTTFDEGYEVHDADPVDVADAVTGQGEMADKAVEWMNEHMAPEGFAFGWHDGEFFLWPDETWEQDS